MIWPDEVLVGKENLTGELWNFYSELHRADLAKAESEQIKLMEAEKRLTGGVRKNLTFGRLKFKVCPEVFYFWEGKLGEGIWKDKSFQKWAEKRFGELISIKSKSANMII